MPCCIGGAGVSPSERVYNSYRPYNAYELYTRVDGMSPAARDGTRSTPARRRSGQIIDSARLLRFGDAAGWLADRPGRWEVLGGGFLDLRGNVGAERRAGGSREREAGRDVAQREREEQGDEDERRGDDDAVRALLLPQMHEEEDDEQRLRHRDDQRDGQGPGAQVHAPGDVRRDGQHDQRDPHQHVRDRGVMLAMLAGSRKSS